MGRLTDDDKKFGPITFGRVDMGCNAIAIKNYGDDNDKYSTCISIYTKNHAIRIALPNFLKPYKEWHEANWDEATVKRLGRTGYWNYEPREFGISLFDGHLSFTYGRQSMDSSTDKQWGFFLPWTQWRHVRHSIYDTDGKLFFEQTKNQEFFSMFEKVKECPKLSFQFLDFDGEEITATTHIEEREWLKGEKWCKWLSWFTVPKICRSLDIEFSSEVGKKKGSWKGGTVGHSIDMLPNEKHEDAFKRYCEKYKLTFIGDKFYWLDTDTQKILEIDRSNIGSDGEPCPPMDCIKVREDTTIKVYEHVGRKTTHLCVGGRALDNDGVYGLHSGSDFDADNYTLLRTFTATLENPEHA